ncbi:MAG: FtsW/RodA/SpoVE family cell cycle protein [Chlorobi bacterium]|nr:FtsW/RodA/SpoVE family cell cycle protein [Chlorobiota bacterium]
MVEKISKYLQGNLVIWMVIIFLSVLSMLAVYSSTGTLAYKYHGGNTFYFFLKQAILLLIGLGITYTTHLIHYKFFYKISSLLLIISIPLLLLTLMLGTSLNEASRWITLPVIGLTFQTSDLAKLALIMYIAQQLSKKQDRIKEFNETFLPIMIAIVVVCGLIIKADFSTAALLFLTSLILMFIGRINIRHLGGLVLVGVVLVSIFVVIGITSGNTGRIGTWKNRITNFMEDDQEGNYQVEQAKIAIVTGGLFGKGPGNSTQRNFLPHPYSDFIYAIIIEEYGLIGGVIILLLYLFLLYHAGAIVRQSSRTYPAFLVIGLMISLVLQAMINMAVAVNIFPVTGQTLPLVSMGGSSILFTSIAFGIILSVSRTVKEEKLQAEEEARLKMEENTIENESENENNY